MRIVHPRQAERPQRLVVTVLAIVLVLGQFLPVVGQAGPVAAAATAPVAPGLASVTSPGSSLGSVPHAAADQGPALAPEAQAAQAPLAPAAPTDTATPTSTPTPTQPVLVDVVAAPTVAAPGTMLVLSYTVFSPVSQQVSLGAGLRQSGNGGWFYDGAHDATVSVPAGTSVVSRLFAIPTSPPNVTYDVIWGLWSAGFGTQYGAMERDGLVQVTGSPPTATATNSPTATPSATNTLPPTATATPTQPVLLNVAAAPTVAAPGTMLVLSYTVFSPVSQQVTLGAGLRQSGNGGWFYDGAHDATVSVPAGTSVVSRLFAIPTSPTNITYDVIWGLWSAGFGTQYGAMERDNLVQVTGAPPTATPTNTTLPTSTPTVTPTPINTAPPTVTPTPTQPVLLSASAAPAAAPYGTLILSYTVFSPSAQQVSLGAGIRVHGSGGGFVTDPLNDTTAALVAGNNVVNRAYTLPGQPNVVYDVVWGLWSPGFGTQYGSSETDSAVSVNGNLPQLAAYRVTQSTGATIVPGTSFVDRTNCNGCTGHVDIPFAFPLYDQAFTVAHVSPNGDFQFPTFTGINSGCLPQAAFGPTLAPLFENLATQNPGEGVYTSISGSPPNRILNVEWRAHNPSTNVPVHFELRLYESQTRFDIIYDQVDNGGANASVGLQRDYGIYQSLGCQTGGLSSGLMLTFVQDPSLPTPVAATPTNTVVPTVTPTSTPANTFTPTVTATPTKTMSPTITATPTNTVPPTATATPTQPVLVAVAAAPTVVAPGSMLVLSYTVFSPVSQQVSLGAGLRQSGNGGWFYDGAHDATVSVPAGTSVVSRVFAIPTSPTNITYDVIWGLWSAGFGTQYGAMERDGLVQVIGSPATATSTNTPLPTSTPTVTPTPTNTLSPTVTPTPTQPVLLSVAAAPTATSPGTMLVLSYTVFSPVSQQITLGAGLRQSGGGWFYDGAHDATVSVPAGTSVVSRVFAIPTSPTNVTYDVIWGLWSAGFGTQYGAMERDGLVQVTGAPATATATGTPTNTSTPTITPTPTITSTPTITPTPTKTLSPTVTPTPTQPALIAVAAGPANPAPASSLVLSYTVFSPVSQQVSLGAGLRQGGGGWFYDGANDRTVSVAAGTSVLTRSFTLPNTANVTYDVIWGLWSAGFGTQYGLMEQDGAVTVVGATPTPAVPALQNVALAPATAFTNGSVVLTYTVFSPVGQQVALGAALAPAGSGQWVDDPARNLVVSVNAGTTVVTRQFNLGTRAAGTYDVRWGLWNATFTTEYADVIRASALTISPITATPTQPASPTATGTPTPTVTGTPPTATNTPVSTLTPNGTTLLAVGLSTGQGRLGGSITLSYTVYSPVGGPVVLAAQIRSATDSFSDPGGDVLVTVPAGTTAVSRQFYISPVFTAGTYDVFWGLWDTCFLTQYAVQSRTAALTFGSATPTSTPLVQFPSPTSSPVPPPGAGAIALGVTGPAAGQQLNPGNSLTLSYTINNNRSSAASVRLVANLSQTSFSTGVTITDTLHETTVNAPVGVSSFTRTFRIPAQAGQGSYDLTWSLVDPATSNVLDTRTSVAYLWIATGGLDNAGISLGAGSALTTPAITLQSGIVNRITGTFAVQNDAGVTEGVVLRLAIRRQGTTLWVRDLPGDALVEVAPGATMWTRSFAIPRYLPSGLYDVLWELGTPDLSGAYDNNQVSGALQIANPAVIANVGVPILMYHNVNPETASGNWVTDCNFTDQMAWLQSNSYTAIDGAALYDYIYKGTPLPAKPIWLTFDDSYQNIYDYAAAIMQAHGMKGSIFAVTQYMGQMNSWDLGNEPQHMHMTWSMLRSLVANGNNPDSHTQHHVHLFDLSPGQQAAEIWGSQRDLVSFLGQPGLSFSYPYGQEPDSAKWMVAHSGFRAATVIGQAKQYTDHADLYELSRLGIADSDTLSTFIGKVTGP